MFDSPRCLLSFSSHWVTPVCAPLIEHPESTQVWFFGIQVRLRPPPVPRLRPSSADGQILSHISAPVLLLTRVYVWRRKITVGTRRPLRFCPTSPILMFLLRDAVFVMVSPPEQFSSRSVFRTLAFHPLRFFYFVARCWWPPSSRTGVADAIGPSFFSLFLRALTHLRLFRCVPLLAVLSPPHL